MFNDMKLKNRILALTAFNCLLFIILFIALILTTGIDAIGSMAVGGLVLVIILVMSSTMLIIKSFNAPLSHMENVIKKVVAGDVKARIGIKTNDELGNISKSIDAMLNDRMTATSDIKDENDTLNDSVVALLETVAQLA